MLDLDQLFDRQAGAAGGGAPTASVTASVSKIRLRMTVSYRLRLPLRNSRQGTARGSLASAQNGRTRIGADRHSEIRGFGPGAVTLHPDWITPRVPPDGLEVAGRPHPPRHDPV